LIGFVGVLAGAAMGLAMAQSYAGGHGLRSVAGITDYMARSVGVYTPLGVSKLLWRASVVLVISMLAALVGHARARREPSEALHYV
jgi:hypothetical protein